MQRILFGLIVILELTGCSQTQPKRDTKTLDFGAFTIETPQSWTKVKEQGTDSYVGRIAIDNKDTLNFDLGWYSNTLTEDEPPIIEHSLLQHMAQLVDTSEIIIVDSQKGIDPDKYRKNNISWDTIDGRKTKFIYPRQSGIGITGVYIDSLWLAGADIDKFNLYGKNLRPENERRVRIALKTLKFHKK